MKGDDWIVCKSHPIIKVAPMAAPEHETIRYKAVHRRQDLSLHYAAGCKLLSHSPLRDFQLRTRNPR
ncbi:hypothetical protein M405DRAFT_830293 [Rhizopogon salebrosus TDB-379]|nr:hypothetical protein M405DRAFT_830293 [Rhizopogon salebrosus TDB-379]